METSTLTLPQRFLEQVEQYSELITDAIDGVGVARRAEALSHYKWDEIKPLLQDRDELPGVDRGLLRNVIRQMDLLDKLNSRAMVDHMTIDQADTSHRLMMSICRCLYLIFFHVPFFHHAYQNETFGVAGLTYSVSVGWTLRTDKSLSKMSETKTPWMPPWISSKTSCRPRHYSGLAPIQPLGRTEQSK